MSHKCKDTSENHSNVNAHYHRRVLITAITDYKASTYIQQGKLIVEGLRMQSSTRQHHRTSLNLCSSPKARSRQTIGIQRGTLLQPPNLHVRRYDLLPALPKRR